MDELPDLPPLTLQDISERLRVPRDEVARWVDPGVPDPAGQTVRLATLPPRAETALIDPMDLVAFIRRRYGLTAPGVRP